MCYPICLKYILDFSTMRLVMPIVGSSSHNDWFQLEQEADIWHRCMVHHMELAGTIEVWEHEVWTTTESGRIYALTIVVSPVLFGIAWHDGHAVHPYKTLKNEGFSEFAKFCRFFISKVLRFFLGVQLCSCLLFVTYISVLHSCNNNGKETISQSYHVTMFSPDPCSKSSNTEFLWQEVDYGETFLVYQTQALTSSHEEE